MVKCSNCGKKYHEREGKCVKCGSTLYEKKSIFGLNDDEKVINISFTFVMVFEVLMVIFSIIGGIAMLFAFPDGIGFLVALIYVPICLFLTFYLSTVYRFFIYILKDVKEINNKLVTEYKGTKKVECPSCNLLIDEANNCPNCGYNFKYVAPQRDLNIKLLVFDETEEEKKETLEDEEW